jgi:hypothetical protein
MLETVTHSCGHSRQFTPKGDGLDDARRERYQRRLCGACAAMKAQEHNEAQAQEALKRLQKRQARQLLESHMGNLPLGTVLILERKGDGWHGTIKAGGKRIELAIPPGRGGGLALYKELTRRFKRLTKDDQG